MSFHNVSNHINLYKNRIINKYARKNLAKIPDGVLESHSYFLRCRRTYVFNNIPLVARVRYQTWSKSCFVFLNFHLQQSSLISCKNQEVLKVWNWMIPSHSQSQESRQKGYKCYKLYSRNNSFLSFVMPKTTMQTA